MPPVFNLSGACALKYHLKSWLFEFLKGIRTIVGGDDWLYRIAGLYFERRKAPACALHPSSLTLVPQTRAARLLLQQRKSCSRWQVVQTRSEAEPVTRPEAHPSRQTAPGGKNHLTRERKQFLWLFRSSNWSLWLSFSVFCPLLVVFIQGKPSRHIEMTQFYYLANDFWFELMVTLFHSPGPNGVRNIF